VRAVQCHLANSSTTNASIKVWHTAELSEVQHSRCDGPPASPSVRAAVRQITDGTFLPQTVEFIVAVLSFVSTNLFWDAFNLANN
jgi:hypothetical protein